MKRLLVFLLLVSSSLLSRAQTIPSEKVKAAFSTAAIKSLTQEQTAEMNFKADHLVSVELAKSNATSDFNLTLVTTGQQVTLSDAEFGNFNPLLYNIPQDEVVCNNLHVQSIEGHSYVLVVLSKQQFDQQLRQFKRDLKTKK